MRKHNKNYSQGNGLEVFVKNGNVEGALRKLKKKIAEDGLMNELKERQFILSLVKNVQKLKRSAKQDMKK